MAGVFSYDTVTVEGQSEQRAITAGTTDTAVPFCLRTIRTEGTHPRIATFYEQLAMAGEKRAAALAAQYAELLTAAATARERCAIREPRLSMETELLRLPQEDERHRLLLRTRITEWNGARKTATEEFFAAWDPRRGILLSPGFSAENPLLKTESTKKGTVSASPSNTPPVSRRR